MKKKTRQFNNKIDGEIAERKLEGRNEELNDINSYKEQIFEEEKRNNGEKTLKEEETEIGQDQNEQDKQ